MFKSLKKSLIYKSIKMDKSIFVYLLINILNPFLLYLTLEYREKLVDSIVLYSNNKETLHIDYIFINLTILLLIMFWVGYASIHFMNFIEVGMKNKYIINFKTLIKNKLQVIEFSTLELPSTKEMIEKSNNCGETVFSFWRNLIQTISYSLNIALIIVYMSSLDKGYIIALLLTLVPVIIISVKMGMSYFNTWVDFSTVRRKTAYYYDVLIEKKYANERIFFGFNEYFEDKWSTEYKNVRKGSISKELEGIKKIQASGILVGIVIVVLFYNLSLKVVSGSVSLGEFVAVFSVLPVIYESFTSTISMIINNVVRDFNTINSVEELLSLPENKGYCDLPDYSIEFKSLEFKNLSFIYPNTEKYVLNNVSFKINKGDSFGIVGVNGAGKSTIIKLIAGLYKPTKGSILINGVDANEISWAKRIGLINVLFQDFEKYYTTVYDNVMLGDITNYGDMDKAKECIKAVELDKKINGLAEGLYAKLGKENEDGQELSGGQWQKLALARVLASPSEIKILDEPTSALDAKSEAVLFNDFRKIIKENTSILISHRLSSVKLVDRILVIDGGTVVEEGSHAELMDEKGLYFEMYNKQKNMYVF